VTLIKSAVFQVPVRKAEKMQQNTATGKSGHVRFPKTFAFKTRASQVEKHMKRPFIRWPLYIEDFALNLV